MVLQLHEYLMRCLSHIHTSPHQRKRPRIMVQLWFNYSALLSTSFLPAASPFSASQFLKTYEDEFVEVVNAKQSLLKLKHKGVISQAVRASIEATKDEEEATYLLLEHLEKNATVDTLREYCKVAIAADGYPRMQELGSKMMETLPPEG